MPGAAAGTGGPDGTGRQNVSLSQAQALGIDRQVLQTLVAQTALDAEAERLKLSVGDETIAQRITQTPAFQGTAGQFDRETYRFTLDRNNLTESSYEASLRPIWRGNC